MKGLIITGGCGFIGLNFLKELFADRTYRSLYQTIVSVDKLGYASEYNIPYYSVICNSNDVIRVDANINDIDAMNMFFNPTSQNNCQLHWDVIDFASNSHVDVSIKEPATLFQENVMIPANLIKWLGGIQKILHYNHISTDEVYGDIELNKVESRENYFYKTSQFNPSNPYAASKVAQDMYLYSMNKTFKLPVTIIRMANQFGFHQHLEKMIPASISRAMKGETIKIYGAGDNMRQWTWVGDTVKNIKNILVNPLKKDIIETFHISDERNLVSNNKLVDLLINALHKNNMHTKKEYVEDRKGHDRAYALASDFSNFDASLEKRVMEVVKWYLQEYKKGAYASNSAV